MLADLGTLRWVEKQLKNVLNTSGSGMCREEQEAIVC